MLRLIPEARPALTERCSGHGGKWGIFTENFDRAIKNGKTTGKNLLKNEPDIIVSECPLAGAHILQGIGALEPGQQPDAEAPHPIELFARAYRVM